MSSVPEPDDRFARLFDDLEADAAAAADLAEESLDDDLTRDARSRVSLADRLRAAEGPLTFVLRGVGTVRGTVVEVGADVAVITGEDGAEWALPARSVLWVDGLGPHASEASRVAAALGLGALLRRWTRDRLPVTLYLLEGGALSGTPDAAGADHLDLAEHDLDEPRRKGAVRRVVTVPYGSVGALRRRR